MAGLKILVSLVQFRPWPPFRGTRSGPQNRPRFQCLGHQFSGSTNGSDLCRRSGSTHTVRTASGTAGSERRPGPPGPNGVRDRRDLRAALAILAEGGRARMEKGGRRRCAAINPALLADREWPSTVGY